MAALPSGASQAAAALLERAYRMALVLEHLGSTEDFDRFVIVSELVAVLDEARTALLLDTRHASASGE